MANEKVANLTVAVALNATDLFYMSRSPYATTPTDDFQVSFALLQSSIAGSLANSSWFTFVGGAATSAANGTALIAAYAAAKLLTPGGAALAANNRHTIILLPGVYTVTGGALVLDTQFIDIVGLRRINGTKLKVAAQSFITGGAVIVSTGIAVTKTANDVWLQSIAIQTTANNVALPAFSGTGNFPNEKFIDVLFTGTGGVNSRGMEDAYTYAGYYEDCCCQTEEGFGSNGNSMTGVAVRCVSGAYSFSSGGGSDATGEFYDCIADGGSFGGAGGNASGNFYRCSFANYGINVSGVASAMFGGGTVGDTANGKFEDCDAGGTAIDSFGGGGGTAGGTYIRCRAMAGGGFGGNSGGTGGTFSGTAKDCEAGVSSFGGGTGNGGTCSGTAINCTGGANSFAGANTNAGTMSGTLLACQLTGRLNATVTGKVERMRIEATGADQTAVLVGASGRLYHCTLIGTGTGFSVDAAGAVNAIIAECIENLGHGVNVTNLIGTPYIVNDTDVA